MGIRFLLPRSGVERGLFTALTAWAVAPLLLLFAYARRTPESGEGLGVFTGSDGVQIGDHLQYISWIRDAGEHVLFSNRFDVVPDPHLFLHPMWVVSGLAWQLGSSIQLAFLAWKPVALLLLFGGFALYVRRLVDSGEWVRGAALALALFFVTPSAAFTEWSGLGGADLRFGSFVMGLEMFPAGFLWGVFPTAIALGLMPVFLLGVERILEPRHGDGGRPSTWCFVVTAVAGLLVSWLHPWQGLTLLLIVGGLVAWGRFRRQYLRLAIPVVATIAPLLYYFALSRTASAWAVVSQPNDMPHVGGWLLIGLAPPLLLAAIGVRGRDLDIGERMLRLWPLAALVVYFGLDSSFFYHALAGISLPLAILGVRGWRRVHAPAAVAVAAIAVLTLPGMAFAVDKLLQDARGHFLTRDEAAAMSYLEHSAEAGAVLAPVEIGRAVPALTDRRTWVGHSTWTPDNAAREQRAKALFAGDMAPSEARAMVRSSGASFLLSDCRGRADLRQSLSPLIESVRQFGCATVYQVDGGPTADADGGQPASRAIAGSNRAPRR